jgi:Cytochrome c7 and related cytochrome c
MGWKKWLLIIVAGASVGVLAGVVSRGQAASPSDSSQYVSSGVFTPAHPTAASAFKDFLDMHPEHPVQPIAFTHTVHLAKHMQCATCHVGVNQGPDARIPNVSFCMGCHMVIDTNNPEIRKIAAYQKRGEDIPWVRVYNYSTSAHVRFNHAPHIRAGVACSTCHGDMTKQTTAERKVNLNMGYCIACHKQKRVSVDCDTCHF